jgi:gamma-glutamyltranspeptidase / glutathione hydrolase
MSTRILLPFLAILLAVSTRAAVPVAVEPVRAARGMVVAAHPEAAAIGVEVLRAGGNAVDAAVAEPYGSGLGGKLMLLFHDARTGRTHAIEAMDQAGGSLDPESFRKLPDRERRYGWNSVCVPGLAAGLELAHRTWGVRPWAENVRPAVGLARGGFTVLPKTRELFAEREEQLRGDAELSRLYLPGGELPRVGSRLANEDLARALELIAAEGAAALYRGALARAIVTSVRQGGGILTLEDFARYEARCVEPLGADWRGVTILGGPPPTNGAALVLPILAALETEPWSGPLRTAANLDKLGRVWQQVQPEVQRRVADVPEARENLAAMLTPDFVAEVRRKAGLAKDRPGAAVTAEPAAAAGFADAEAEFEPVHASTTHFIVVDAAGNVVCATQSQSLHFGAAVVAPGTGIVLNDTMSNFAFANPRGVNYLAPSKRPRSTITPTLVLRDGRPVLALGLPGAQRIPTAVLQVLLDHLAFGRPLAEAIGDTRLHWLSPLAAGDPNNVLEVEASLAAEVEEGLVSRGWTVVRREEAGTGRHFGGLNAVELHPDGSRTGYADPRRTNAAAGY